MVKNFIKCLWCDENIILTKKCQCPVCGAKYDMDLIYEAAIKTKHLSLENIEVLYENYCIDCTITGKNEITFSSLYGEGEKIIGNPNNIDIEEVLKAFGEAIYY